MTNPYDPLDTLNLARSIEQEILRQPLRPINDLRTANGAGVYAIYYTGDLPMYAPLAQSMKSSIQKPIYVGKAIPIGGRIGGLTRDSAAGRRLGERLGIHADSIKETTNLKLEEFYARCLIVSDVWISLGENMLIQQFQPVWNVVASGFGNKAPGKGRQEQAMSLWDTLHPGRVHSQRLGPNRTPVLEIEARIVRFLKGEQVPLALEHEDAPEQE